MNKKLSKAITKYAGVEFDQYKLIYADVEGNKLIKPFLIVFALITAFFILDQLVLDLGFNLLIYFLTFLVFVAYPLSRKTDYKDEILIVTPTYWLQRTDKKEFHQVVVNKITSFNHDDDSFTVESSSDFITIDYRKYQEHLDKLIDILEAKGKTFDKEKDYMIRDVEIQIIDNKIVIKDIKREDTNIEKITAKLYKDYPTLTPGFINEIIPKNAQVNKVYSKGKDLYIELSHFEVNPGHIENTGFESIIVEDCIFVFENCVFKELSKRESHDRKSPFIPLENTTEVFAKESVNGVISEWRFNKNKADIIFAVGVVALKVSFEFTEVLIGWKKVK